MRIFLLLLLAGCGVPNAREPNQTYTVNEELSAQVQRIAAGAHYCDGGLAAEGPNTVTGRPDCRTGDSMMWSGLYYSVFPKASIGEAIKNSIGADFRPYRSPENRKGDVLDTFSRDMWTGFMAYCLRADDHANCNGVWGYTKNNDFQACPDTSDNRCWISYSMRYLTGYVWDAHGWYISSAAKATQVERAADEQVTMESARMNKLGYRMHLIAARMYLYKRMGRLTNNYRDVISKVVERDPTDLFYKFLDDQDITAELLVHMKSWERPVTGYSQWVWGDTVNRETGASRMHESMGHDLVFLACNIVECK